MFPVMQSLHLMKLIGIFDVVSLAKLVLFQKVKSIWTFETDQLIIAEPQSHMTGSCKLTGYWETYQVFCHFDSTNWNISLKTALQRPRGCLDGVIERGIRKKDMWGRETPHAHTHSSSLSRPPWEETLIVHVFINTLVMSTLLHIVVLSVYCIHWMEHSAMYFKHTFLIMPSMPKNTTLCPCPSFLYLFISCHHWAGEE